MNHKDIAALMAGIAPIIKEEIARHISELQPAEPGARGDIGPPGKDGSPGRDGINGKDGEPGKDGKDGRDGKDADEELIARMIDIAIAKLPQPINGKDGESGQDGKDGRDGLPGIAGRDGINGKDGEPGKDGKDGLGFDDFHVEYDGERKLSFIYSREQETKRNDFELPLPIDRGIWKEGEFKRGDAVTWGGSLWLAQRNTAEKPDTPDSGWRLAVKRGRDGKTVAKI